MKGINTAGQALRPPPGGFRGKPRGIEPFGSSLARSCPCKHGRDLAPFVNKAKLPAVRSDYNLSLSDLLLSLSDLLLSLSDLLLSLSDLLLSLSDLLLSLSDLLLSLSDLLLSRSDLLLSPSEMFLRGSERFLSRSERFLSRSNPLCGFELGVLRVAQNSVLG
jgi:hypothetical protein